MPALPLATVSTGSPPAARELATVVPRRSGRLVQLPARFARAAVERLLGVCRAPGDLVEGPGAEHLVGRPLLANEWAIRLGPRAWGPQLFGREVRRYAGFEVHVLAKYEVALPAAQARWLLQALEHVKPVETEPDGRPLAWVAEEYETERLRAAGVEDDDAVLVDDGALPETVPDDTVEGAETLSNKEIRDWFAELATAAGFVPPPLSLTRGTENKLGFTTGRVWFRADYVPLRVHLTTCPNADLAEVLATIVHELAHPLARSRAHGEEFRRALLALAERRWGERWFVEARGRMGEGLPTLDYWVATGIRAALRQAAPPVARAGDDGQMARIVTKIRKLRELAADQLGLPEAIAATATANDLVTTYGLGSYAVRIDARIQDQMIDRWLVLDDSAVWKRVLVHAIAAANDVFSLSVKSKSGLHLFGRFADIVQVEYLFSISAARIARECERHLAAWKSARPRLAGETLRERTAFCDSAVRAFERKLRQIADDEVPSHRGGSSRGLEAAEAFALAEHEKRGMSWGSGGKRVTRENAAGAEVGRSLEVVRGLSTTGGPQRKLTGG
jgi:hypothetical protein